MNITEANILALVVQAKAIEVEVLSMQAIDKEAIANGTAQCSAKSYFDSAQSLYAISNEIQQLARSGYL